MGLFAEGSVIMASIDSLGNPMGLSVLDKPEIALLLW